MNSQLSIFRATGQIDSYGLKINFHAFNTICRVLDISARDHGWCNPAETSSSYILTGQTVYASEADDVQLVLNKFNSTVSVVLTTIKAQVDVTQNELSKVIWEGDKPIGSIIFTPQKAKPFKGPNIARGFQESAFDNMISSWQANPELKMDIPIFLISNQDNVPFNDMKKYEKNKVGWKPVFQDTNKPDVHIDLSKDNFKCSNYGSKIQNTAAPNFEGYYNHRNIEDISNKGSELIKYKIINLAKETVKGLNAKSQVVDKVHELYKHNKLYKLGYVVSYINKTSEGVKSMLQYMHMNKDTWDVIKILNVYEQIKKAKEFLSEMLSVLKYLEMASSYKQKPQDAPNIEKQGAAHGIAWSYYDDENF